VQAQEGLGRARLSLAAATALPLSRAAALTLRFDDLERNDIGRQRAGDLQSLALQNRLDVRTAVARYAAADAALRLELARQWPDLVLRPGFLWDQGDRVWSLGLGLTWPPGGRNQAAIAAAQARRDTEAARFAAVQAAALASLEAAREGVDAALAQREAAQTRWAEAQEAARRAERRLAAGHADRPEVLAAALSGAETRGQWIDAQSAAWAAFGALEDATQIPLGGTPPPAP
jgi:outer membrane protein, heavy metal efflux system